MNNKNKGLEAFVGCYAEIRKEQKEKDRERELEYIFWKSQFESSFGDGFSD